MKLKVFLGALVAVAVITAGGAAADTLTLTLVSQNSTTITLGWEPQSGYGYLFSADGNLVSRTNDPSRNSVRFSKSFSTYEVAVIVKGATGTWPPDTPPPGPPTATFTMSPSPAVTGQPVTFDWTGTCPAGGCTVVWEDEGPDGPGGTDWPWGTGDPLQFTFANEGTKYAHLTVTDSTGATAESRQELTVTSVSTPPPPPPPPPPPGEFPDASNTGVPDGTVLTNVSGFLDTTSNGQVIENVRMTSGCVHVHHTGVTVRNSFLTCVRVVSSAAQNPANPPLHVYDVTIVCNNSISDRGIEYKNFIIERADISVCENGADINSYVTMRDNYLHDLGPTPVGDAHVDGVQASWGANSVLEHNTILSRDTSSIAWFNYDGNATVPNWTINNNLLGAQTSASVANVIYCPSGTPSNAFITNNKFKTQFPPVEKYSTGCNRPGITWSGNTSYETGAPILVDQDG